MGFVKPPRGKAGAPSPHLFVANCGPALGLDLPSIHLFFETSFGPLAGPVCQADASGTRVIVSFRETADAVSALTALHAVPCPSLLNRTLHIRFSHQQPPRSQVKESSPVFRTAADIGIPGLFLFENFTSKEEEQELLAAVDKKTWHSLAKRRVQHYGYEFHYKTRNVNTSQKLGELPGFAQLVVQRISQLPQVATSREISLPLDQLTVNEYPAGVGLSPHIDTHSAFVGAIISLSMAGPCVMEFRKYEPLVGNSLHDESDEMPFGESGLLDVENQHDVGLSGKKSRCPLECRSLLLPERSLLVLLDEARYRWHHYIPHHKVDHVLGETIRRCQRRVSFTFRKVRHGPCRCRFESCCDSQAFT